MRTNETFHWKRYKRNKNKYRQKQTKNNVFIHTHQAPLISYTKAFIITTKSLYMTLVITINIQCGQYGIFDNKQRRKSAVDMFITFVSFFFRFKRRFVLFLYFDNYAGNQSLVNWCLIVNTTKYQFLVQFVYSVDRWPWFFFVFPSALLFI